MNTFEHTSKLLAIAQKTANGAEFGFVMAGVYSEMLRSDTADVGTKSDFTAKAGHIQVWLFLRKLLVYMKKRLLYRAASDEEAALMQRAWELADDPVALCIPTKQGDVSWRSGLPDFMMRAMNFLQGCMVGKHNETLKGSLGGSIGPLQVESFLEAGSVKAVWTEIESSLAKANGEPEERTPATEQEKSKAEQAKQKLKDKQDSLKVLQADALEEAERLHDQRSVLLVPDTANPVSALLDGQTLVPAITSDDFEQFLGTWLRVHTKSQDFLFVLTGKVRSNEAMIEKLLVKNKVNFKRLILCYDESQMRAAGYYTRLRGFCNSASSEVAFVGWSGKLPKLSQRSRVYVDPGTDVYSDVLQRVPVSDKADLNTCSAKDREELLKVCGVAAADNGDEEEADQEDGEDDGPVKRKYAKRFSGKALFRAPSCPDDVVMFPLDPSIALYQEIFNQLGPSWVLLGTPGGGNGVLGALKSGLPSVSIYRSKLHASLARQFILRKLAELMCMPGSLANTHLVLRAQALNPPRVSKKAKKSEASPSSSAGSDESSSLGEPEETAELPAVLGGKEKEKEKEKKIKTPVKEKKTPKKTTAKKDKTPKKDVPKKKEKSEKEKSVNKKEKKTK
ncbi:unnamed protein product [Symbiodinium sp. CCMP2592]|nr:unnamed protein product [Symbiodinium sp. CCMP2592]